MANINLIYAAGNSNLEGKRSVRYLRVSYRGQMDTDADVVADGNSIDSQRKATMAKENALGLVNVGEYIEPGNSGRSIEGRKEFKKLLKRIVEQGDVDYLVIDMRSRAFRNHFDATITKRQLLKLGVKLISAKEDFGEGIMADAMEAITDIFNEVQVRLTGEDVRAKMGNKAKNGGTISRAKIGYLNVRKRVDGKEIRTVIVDPERGRYITMAFELFATGRYTGEQLLEQLTDAGLRLPATARWPERPISQNRLYSLLRDRYYLAEIVYERMIYPGRHKPLTDPETFDRVQRVLDSHSGSGTRKRTHHHYLKGTVWCGRCSKRYIIMPGKGNGGLYFYYICRGRQDHSCDQPYIPVDVMERAVVEHYGRAVWLPTEFRIRLKQAVTEAVAADSNLSTETRTELGRRLAALDKKENYLLDLAAEDDWPKDKLRAKVQTLRDERRQIERTIAQGEQLLATGQAIFEQALALMAQPRRFYEQASESVRVILNKAFFTKLYVDGHKVTDHELNEPFSVLREVYEIERGGGGAEASTSIQADVPRDTGLNDHRSLSAFLERSFESGSSKPDMVGDTGIEPVTSTVSR